MTATGEPSGSSDRKRGRPERRRAERIFDVLLLVYPPAHRRRFGTSMRSAFQAELEERGSGARRRALFWGVTAAHVLWSAAIEWAVAGRRALAGGAGWATAMRSDAAAAWKSAVRGPRTSLAAVLCIALGTAATSAVLTLYTATVLRPLPFDDAERLVRVWIAEEGVGDRLALSLPDALELQERVRSIDPLVVVGRSRVMFLGDRGARRVEGEAVSPGYFELLGVRPALGRFFTAEDHAGQSPPAMVLAHRHWVDRFGADPTVLGTTVRTTLRDYTVVGIAPSDFHGTVENDMPDIEFWVPAEHDRTEAVRLSRSAGYVWTVGRLAEGASVERAHAEADAVGDEIARVYPDEYRGRSFRVEPMGENWRSDLRARGMGLLAAAGLLLLIAAVNTAALLTTRSIDRREIMAVRAALGAGRARLIRQVLAETTLLTVAGAVLGSLAAPSVLRAFLRLAPEEVPDYVTMAPDARALGLALVALAITALIAGALPAAVGGGVGAGESLRTRSHGGARRARALGELVIVAEVALTVALVVGAGLLIRSYDALGESELGYTADGVLNLAIFVDSVDVDRDEELLALQGRIRDRLAAHPGVRRVALVNPTLPPGIGRGDTRLEWAGMTPAAMERGVPAHRHHVDAGFFDALEIEVVAGRTIEEGDGASGVPPAVVSASVAELLGGRDEALGRELRIGGEPHRVVGVVRDVRYQGPVRLRARDADVYTPLSRIPTRLLSIAVRTDGDPADLVDPMSRALNAMAPRSALDWVDPMTRSIDGHFQGPRFYLMLVSAFAASALGLMAVGLFGALATLVARRRPEIGIRRALGAARGRLLGAIVLRGLAIAAVGLAVGALGSVVVGRALGSMLYGVSAFDPVTLAGTAAVVLCVTLAASAIPGVRAARVSPASALDER